MRNKHVTNSLLATSAFVLGMGPCATAQEVLFKPSFEPGARYVYQHAMQTDDKITGKVDTFKIADLEDNRELEITFAVTFQQPVDGTSTAELTVDHAKGSARFEGKTASFATSEAFPDKKDLSKAEYTAREDWGSCTRLQAKPHALKLDARGWPVRTDGQGTSINLEALQGQAWAVQMADQLFRFPAEGLPTEPVRPGAKWKHEHQFNFYTSAGALTVGLNLGTLPLTVEYTFVGLSDAPGGAKGQARISYTATIDEQPEHGAITGQMGKGVKTTQFELRMTGALYYDPKQRIFTKHTRVFDFKWNRSGRNEGVRSKFTNTVHRTYATDLVSTLPLPGAAPAEPPRPATPAPDLVAERDWTNANGKKLTAVLTKVERGVGTFRRPGGQEFNYAIANLSKPDQELIDDALKARLAKGK